MEILVWGDIMKRQMSISIFLAIFVVLLTFIYIKFNNDMNPKTGDLQNQTEDNTNSITISQEYITYKFYVVEEDGRLVVYETKTQRIYAETGIETYTLPDEIRQNLETGIYFESEAELYDFLESYSS